jgi:hypothetical protein
MGDLKIKKITHKFHHTLIFVCAFILFNQKNYYLLTQNKQQTIGI